MKSIIGEYNRYGYVIFVIDDGVPLDIYHAGNAVADSTSNLPLTARRVVPLRKLRAWCIREARQEAAQRGITYGAVSRVGDDEGAL